MVRDPRRASAAGSSSTITSVPRHDPAELAQRRGAIAHVADRRQADRDVDRMRSASGSASPAARTTDTPGCVARAKSRLGSTAMHREARVAGRGARANVAGPDSRGRAAGVRGRARGHPVEQALVEVAECRPLGRGVAPRARTLERVPDRTGEPGATHVGSIARRRWTVHRLAEHCLHMVVLAPRFARSIRSAGDSGPTVDVRSTP